MLTTKEYNFEMIFEKLDDAKKHGDDTSSYIDANLLKQVDSDIESLRGYIEAINDAQYQTYSRS